MGPAYKFDSKMGLLVRMVGLRERCMYAAEVWWADTDKYGRPASMVAPKYGGPARMVHVCSRSMVQLILTSV